MSVYYPRDSREHALQASVKEEACPSESNVSKQNWRLPVTLDLSGLSDKRSATIPDPLEQDKKKRSPCEKHFSNHAALDRHQFARAERTHVCAEYGKCFAQKRDPAMRLRVHAGEKRFKCTRCEKCFIQKRQLLRHQETHITKPPACAESAGDVFKPFMIFGVTRSLMQEKRRSW
ncbi:unnamed protein product [Natator depressus]